MTEHIFATDAYAREMSAAVVDTDPYDKRILLDRTVFYPGGGGQPCDQGELWIGDDRLPVTKTGQDSRGVWHWVDGALPSTGTAVRGVIDWERRYTLMRTHTAVHALCGVMWNRYQSPVTGSDMKVGEGRLDFEMLVWNPDHQPEIEQELNRRLQERLPVEVTFLPREEADQDPSLIRTKVSLLPPTLRTVRVIDIVGLDKQADGGTHVHGTDEVGRVRITKVETKGRAFRRLRLAIE